MRVTIAQINPTVGDLQGNVRRLQETLQTCCAEMPDLVVFPELYLTGYPPKDLLERAWFITRVQGAVDRVRQISRDYPKTGILFGAPLPNGEKSGRALRNAALLVHNGEIVASRTKMLLPTYDVFDEARYFEPAAAVQVVPFKGERLGIHICEDAWTDPALWDRRYVYDRDPVQMLVAQGATALINISSSPFNVGKERVRYRLVRGHAMRYGIPFLYVNQVGGNDDLLFDGRSLCVDAQGDPIVVMEGFREEVVTVDLAASGTPGGYEPQEETASVYDALVMGTRDYLHKTGFSRAVVGLSGGVDSAVTCALAVAALGRENVLGVSMPSPYSSQGSIDDARRLAENLGIEYRVVPITDVYGAYLEAMQPHFADTKPDVTEENIQARIRGNILMALSNKFGYLVLSTGNKSELAVGYCTLYGDMSGGLAVISDVPKGMVYDLAYYINRDGEIIPSSSIEKPPSAELRPDQVDQDSLPPYPVLDAILYAYVEEGYPVQEIIESGYDAETVYWVARAVDRNEYKRKQAAPGLRVMSKAFGVGRRMPIAARFEL
ncbi:MAG: NAD+ synthase [Anaerolineae bacterium]|jgi:NAD+ synthase (glutamine-hydrolysing)